MKSYTFTRTGAGPRDVDLFPVWTVSETRSIFGELLERWATRLPRDPHDPIVIKPNLNNDLVALTGNCTDLRVLAALLEGLAARGYRDLTIADGSNVGVDRRGIDSFRRLRVDQLSRRFGARLVDLNQARGRRVELGAGAAPEVAALVQDASCLISVPKIKTHTEMVLSCAMKNWVGLARGQDKRQVHYSLAANILELNKKITPHLVIVDGLVGMEGNGPGDGEPFRFGHLLVTDDAFLCDLVVCRMMNIPWREVPYLLAAEKSGRLSGELAEEVIELVQVEWSIHRAPRRGALARLASSRKTLWVKPIIRLVSDRALGMGLAYRMGIVQDIYGSRDDTLRVVQRLEERCGDCRRCEGFCPTGLRLEEIGKQTEFPACIQCLYCYLCCPRDAIVISGEPGAMERQISRYREAIARL